MKKAIFLDLDGTLLSNNYSISSINKKAIKDATNAGWDIILTTGKSYANSIAFYKELGLNTWFSTSQGQVVSKPEDGIFEEKFLNFEDIKSVLKDHVDNISNVIVETTQGIYVKNPDDTSVSKFIGKDLIKYNGEHLEGIIGLYVAVNKKVFIDTPQMDIWKWDTGQGMKILSFKPKNVCKVSVMEDLIEREGYEKTVVFGNGRNDLRSILKADLGFAMKNSHPKLLAVAKHVTSQTNDDSGVGVEIMKILSGEVNVG